MEPSGVPGDHNQRLYRLHCEDCHYEYGANGADIFERRCPQCQGGAAALPLVDRREEQRERLGRTLARVKLGTRTEGANALVEIDMKSIVHQVLDIEPTDLIEVIENFPHYMKALEDQHAEWRAEDGERRR